MSEEKNISTFIQDLIVQLFFNCFSASYGVKTLAKVVAVSLSFSFPHTLALSLFLSHTSFLSLAHPLTLSLKQQNPVALTHSHTHKYKDKHTHKLKHMHTYKKTTLGINTHSTFLSLIVYLSFFQWHSRKKSFESLV